MRRYMKNIGGVIGAIVLILLVLMSILAPYLAPHDPIQINPRQALRSPGKDFLMGTDQFGRDIYSRVLYGSRISLFMGLVAVSISILIGVPMGLVAGYYGRWLDNVLSRFIDVLLAFPGYFLAMVLVASLGFGFQNVMIAVGVASMPQYFRVVRGSVLSAKESDYVVAARALGASDFLIMVRHILPNVIAPVIILGTLGVAYAILIGSALSFLGLGAQPPTPEWGAMVGRGREYLRVAWWMSTFPALGIMLTVLSINLVGDTIRDVLDPRLKGY